MLVYISAEFRRVRNRPILTKNPGLYPMVLNMADLGKCWDSFQTAWIASYFLANGFPTTFENVSEDFGWIPKGPKSADFDQKAWAHGFEHGGFG